MKEHLPRLIAVVGPTASGKTAIAERLAYKFSGEIVSADSRTVYRGMDIGTAKVRGAVAQHGPYAGAVYHGGTHHWLLDVVAPNESFTVAQWKKEAMEVIARIHKRHHLPVVVGGTGLYVQSVIDNFEPPQIAPDAALRSELESQTLSALVQLLKKYDPDAVERIDIKNPRRVIRALEICISSGQPFAAQRRRGTPLYHALQIGIAIPREELYARIDTRVREQIRDGLFREVATLVETYGPDIPALSAIGYRQVVSYLQKKCPKAEAIERIMFDSHAYARRQLTWLRRDTRIVWVKNVEEAEIAVRTFLVEDGM
jgi:tRNA dimethylallyltransferase